MTQRKMKDSGVAWIGQVPEGWSVGRAGFYYQIQLGKMLCGCQLSSAYTRERYFCAANVHYDGASDDDLKEMWFLPSEYTTYQVLPGDMLVVCDLQPQMLYCNVRCTDASSGVSNLAPRFRDFPRDFAFSGSKLAVSPGKARFRVKLRHADPGLRT